MLFKRFLATQWMFEMNQHIQTKVLEMKNFSHERQTNLCGQVSRLDRVSENVTEWDRNVTISLSETKGALGNMTSDSKNNQL